MATNPYVNIPLPPVTGPFLTPPTALAPPGIAWIRQYIWVPVNNAWGIGPTVPYAWDSYPLGYYHTPIDWTGLPQVTVVEARTYPDGTVAPNVLYDPSAGTWIQTSGAGEPLPPPPPIANLPPPSPPLCASGEVFIPWFEGTAENGQPW